MSPFSPHAPLGQRSAIALGSLLVLSGSLLSGAAAAQTSVVVPASAKSVDGNAVEGRPFGSDRMRLSQYLGIGVLTGVLPRNKTIIEIAYRRDQKSMPTVTMTHATTPTWQIRMGNLFKTNVSDPDGRFLGPGSGAGGTGTSPDTLKIAFTAKRVSFPNLAPSSTLPAFSIRFKLDSPLLYLGRGLAIDHYTYETRNRTSLYFVDAVRSTVNTGKSSQFGTSCPAGQNRAYAIPSNPGGDPVKLLLFDGPQGKGVAAGIIGLSKTFWGPVPLPLDLTSAGLKGCNLYVSADVFLPVATSSTGSAMIQVPLPADKNLAGVSWYFQYLVFDARVNLSFPLSFSNGVQITNGLTVGKGPGLHASFLYGYNVLARGRYGLRDKGISLVTQITYR